MKTISILENVESYTLNFANRNSEIHVKYDFNVTFTVGKNFYNTAGDNYNNYL